MEPETANGTRQPFDTSDLRDIPQAYSDDPPYQDLWVVDTRGRDTGKSG